LFFIGSLISICTYSQKINPANPDLSPGNFRLDSLPDSEINIPIQVNLKPVYTMAEKSVDTMFTSPNYPEGWVQDGCATRFKYVFRRSKLLMKATGTSMTLGFTGYYKIVGSTRVCVSGTVISPWTPACRCGFGSEGERKVNVSFTNTLTVLPDFKVKLNIKRNEPQPLDKCEVCFWGQDITGQVIKGLTVELDAAKKDLDKNYGTVDLRSRFQQLWNQLNKVYGIYGLGWLKINPQKIRINNLFALNDSLNIFIGLSAKPVISFEKPAEQNSVIPNIGSFSRQPGFNIFLDAVLSYDSLGNLMNQQLKGKEFTFKKGFIKKHFVIDTCTIYGGGFEKLIIKIKFSGTNTGVVYLLGRPVYDKDKKTIEVADIDFDIKSKNVLLGSADWLFDKKITKEISKNARFELGAFIDTAKLSINKELNREWVKGIRSYGNIKEISIVGIYPMQQHLVLRSNCAGELSVKVESVNFSL
ncbi:MAG TPA: DUF4403 family protein, partial [Chitinophagaceae bacterium]|nr:DUF4403 family protein [Chitinophagaceae bacterium]